LARVPAEQEPGLRVGQLLAVNGGGRGAQPADSKKG
jgi:hypothetical protein